MFSLLLITYAILAVYGVDITADGDHKCCMAYTDRQACKARDDGYGCYWLNKKDPAERTLYQKVNAQCVGLNYATCKIPDPNANCFDGDNDCPDDVCVYNSKVTQRRYDTVVVPALAEDEELEADAANYCCKAYKRETKCMNRKDNYNCYWLDENNPSEYILISKWGSKCLGANFVECKLADICDDCFNGGSAGTPDCVYNDENAIFADVNIGQSIEHNWLLDWRVLFGAACVVFVVFASFFYYKRNNKNGKYALIDEYGSTQVSN